MQGSIISRLMIEIRHKSLDVQGKLDKTVIYLWLINIRCVRLKILFSASRYVLCAMFSRRDASSLALILSSPEDDHDHFS